MTGLDRRRVPVAKLDVLGFHAGLWFVDDTSLCSISWGTSIPFQQPVLSQNPDLKVAEGSR